MTTQRVLAGPSLAAGPESFADHQRRLGPRPPAAGVIEVLGASGLLGRGGAGFPVARKWATVAERGDGRAVVLANGAEGEPLSSKDRAIMTARPHLVLDGAELAAEAVGADRIVLYVGGEHAAALAAMERAAAERTAVKGRRPASVPIELVAAPHTYIAGEESAAVHYINAGDARPTTTPPRPFERGVGGRPTLVQNVESLAHVALIARYGDAWYRQLGTGTTRGSAVVTVGGAVSHAGVTEIALGTTIRDLASLAGAADGIGAVLLGGYFGGWLRAHEAWDLPLDPVTLRSAGSAFGCGVVHFLRPDACGVRATARILDYMAGQSAAQCGPCAFGLRAIADAAARLASPDGTTGDDLERVARWSGQLAGRGACRHPDGAVGLLRSSLRVFADEFIRHERSRTCIQGDRRGRAA
jgi:NADH:ubiquinone oxidoreductase subunit F (NADH-binding)